MSKKLSGNGRWESSRMMLPEHRTQFLEKAGEVGGGPTANPRVATKEELEMIRSFVMLPMILTIADKNRQEVERTSYTLKPLYQRITLLFMDVVSRELTQVRKELRQRNIKVIEDEQAELVMYYRYVCRGYEERFGMVREVVRAEMSRRFTRFILELLKPLGVRET